MVESNRRYEGPMAFPENETENVYMGPEADEWKVYFSPFIRLSIPVRS